MIRGELERLAADGVSDQELEDAKGAGAGGGALALESMQARMNRLARAELVLGEFADLDVGVTRMNEVESSDIQGLASELLTASFTSEIIGPLAPEARAELEALP